MSLIVSSHVLGKKIEQKLPTSGALDVGMPKLFK